jgi:hypothetical protein
MEIQARQLLVAVFGIVIAIGFANTVQGETATPVVVGLAKCSDCARRNMNAEAAFKGRPCLVPNSSPKFHYVKRRFLITLKCRQMHGVLNVDEIKN